MAIPGAVQRRKEQEMNALREAGFDPNGAPLDVQAASGDPAPAASPDPAPTPTDDTQAMQARIAELEGLLSTQNGRTSATSRELEDLRRQLAAVSDNRTFLEGKLTELTTQLEALQAARDTQANANVTAVLDESGPTAEQMQAFGPESVDFVTRVARREMSGVLKPLLARFADLEKQVGRVKDIDAKLPQLESAAHVAHINDARTRELEFLRKEILPHFPDFESVRETQEWRDYLSQDVPDRGYKIGQLLQTYRRTADAVGLRTLIGAFYDQRKAKVSKSLESLTVPAKTGSDAPPKPNSPKMKASEYRQKLREFTSKRLSKEAWEEYRTRWDQASASGNVDMDVELR